MSKGNHDPTRFRRLLVEQRDELLCQSATGDAAAAPVELDQTRVGRLSRMDAMQAQAMSVEAQQRRRARLRGVAAALARIESGDFGFCADCGESIALRRLEIDPTVTLCIGCASARER